MRGRVVFRVLFFVERVPREDWSRDAWVRRVTAVSPRLSETAAVFRSDVAVVRLKFFVVSLV